MNDANPPSDDELRLRMAKTMEQMFLHAQAGERVLLAVQARVEGAMAVAGVVDENQTQIDTDRHVAAQKEIISHLYEKSHQYVTITIGGAYAAYFATLGVLAERFSDRELLTSALLMTVSLTVFVLWEVGSIAHIGYHMIKGDWGTATGSSRWQTIGWPVVIFFSLATAVPSIALSVWVYLRRLGAVDWLTALWA